MRHSLVKNYFGALIILLICENTFGVMGGVSDGEPQPQPHWSNKRSNSSRSLGFKPKKNRTTTTRPTWRPKQNGKLLLAKQKGLKVESLNEIPADDPEFTYSWPDDYYDTYDFEHRKNMLQHGTFEARIQNYYKAELAEALANLNATAAESNFTDVEEVSDATEGPSKTQNLVLNLSTSSPRNSIILATINPSEETKAQNTKKPPILVVTSESPKSLNIATQPPQTKSDDSNTRPAEKRIINEEH